MTVEGLTTRGSEFTLPNGAPYSGRYHVHIDKGAMVGAKHVSTPHSILIPVNAEVANKVISLQRELRAKRDQQNKIKSMSSRSSRRTTNTSRNVGGY